SQAFEGLMELVGEYHPSTLTALNNLGQVYEETGLYDKAEPILKQALVGYEEILGRGNQQTSRARNNLALLYESQGNFREAEPLYKESLAYLIETQGEDFTDTIAVRNNLAFLYMLMEDFEQSAEMFEQVLEQWMVLFGEDHQATLKALNNLGRIYHRLNRLEEAEQLVLQALDIRRSVLGSEHPDVVRSMVDLGSIYIDEKRLDEADATLSEALALAEKVLGDQHPYTFEALNNLARVKEAQNLLQAAVQLREIGFSRRSGFLDRMLWVTGENAREGYVRLHRPEFNEYLSLLTRLESGEGGKLAIAASLQRKGLLLKVTSEIQQISQLSADPALAEVSDLLKSVRKELAALTLSGPTPETKGRHAQALYDLEQQVNELQGQLGRASVRYRSSIAQIGVDSLAAALPESTVLVDFLTYEEGDEQKLLAGIAIKEGEEVRYELVRYADRNEIEAAVLEYREIIQDDQADEDEMLELGQIAYEQVWEPIHEAIGDFGYVYLIPDGVLNILPFNALVDLDDEYLIQSVDLHVLTSGRDLLPNGYKLSQGEYVILAGPDYNSDEVVSKDIIKAAEGRRSAALQLGIRGAGGGLRGLNFAPLPGAEKEGRIISDQIVENQAPNEVFFGLEAQEQVLSDINQPPEILHLATHGFFLKADDTLRKRLLKLQRGADLHVPPPGDNPLLRAGLAFAGINANAQFLGDIDTLNDGVLTALEVLDLNLSGTKLVVLSACETGLGEIHEGEGVYGLRRSFQEAGVAEVVSSLWEVSDAGTQALMTDFYDRILSGVPARDALRQTQLEMMDSPEWGYPYIWSAFMIVGSYESAGITVQ
ncbi:MAG: CHAT domain-containing protein, partial [Planctomycetaceae bacterium]|nr:CHAT domain-containing protein [Planctomycetaceae bacterium]